MCVFLVHSSKDLICNGMNQFNPDYLISVFELHLESLPVSFTEFELTFMFMPKWLGHQMSFYLHKMSIIDIVNLKEL